MAAISESEAGEVWKALREARVRSLYFGDMQARYGKCKQWVQGLSLVLSSGAVVSGAVVSMVGDLWSGVAPVLAGVVAIVNAIAIATSLDQKLVTPVGALGGC